MAVINRFPLKIEYWFVTHKREFQRWWNILFIGIDAVLVLYVLVSLLLYLVFLPRTIRHIEAMGLNTSDAPALAHLRPQPPVTESVAVIPSGESSVDLVARVRNPNTAWYVAEMRYAFQIGAGETEIQSSYLSPGEEKYVFQLNVPVQGSVESVAANLTVSSVAYQRHRPTDHRPEPAFTFSDVRFTQPQLSGDTDGRGMRIDATVTNQSLTGFKNVTVRCLLFADDEPSGIGVDTVGALPRGKSAPVVCTWLQRAPVSNVVFEAETDVLDPLNILPFDSVASDDEATISPNE